MIDRELAYARAHPGRDPLDIQVDVNGRQWLARALDKAGIGYVRFDNSLLAIDDLEAAAELCERFALGSWAASCIRSLQVVVLAALRALHLDRRRQPSEEPIGKQCQAARSHRQSDLLSAADLGEAGTTSEAS